MLRIERLEKRHDRQSFDCGNQDLNDFLKRYARQNQTRGLSRSFVLIGAADPRVMGFYTLSAGHIEFAELPDDLAAKLPRYPLPVAHLGRLATCLSVRGQGLGEVLLFDALDRIAGTADQIGIAAVEVRAKSERARAWYSRYGFIALPDSPRHLYLPISALRRFRGTERPLADT